MLRIFVISVLLPIVLLLEPSTCNHLVSILLDVLELVLEDLGPHVGGYLGLGVLPCLDGLHNLVLLSSVDVNVIIEGVGSSILLSTANSSVQAACELVGDLESEGPRGDGEHGLGVQLRLGGLSSWVLLNRLHVNVLLVAPCKLVGGLDLESEGPRVDGSLDLAYSVVLAAFTAGFHSSSSLST